MTILTAVAILGVFLVIGGVRVLRKQDPGGRPDQSRPGPVILVPGYGGSRTALLQLASRLAVTGRSTQVLNLPDGGTGDLLTQSDTLDTAVRAALRNGAPSVDVVGYSAGGVVTRLWVARHDGAAVARRIVTLGSPLHGAEIAGVGSALAPDACPQACRELVPGSAVLAGIDKQSLPKGLPWLSIWTQDDETVQPPDSARLDGAVNLAIQSICPQNRVSHSGLPTDPAITALVIEALGTSRLTAPKECPAG
jgi:triacylglycerol esterase/lipase EstA (alpha/beta hydrolase family)